jgi:alpha-beta hydrolase superfamily lysophospholipase
MSGVTVMAVVVASCSSSPRSGWSASAATTSSAHAPAPTTSAQPLEAAPTAEAAEAAECSPRRASRQRDTGPLQHGRWDQPRRRRGRDRHGRGVLAHEYDNDLCGACRFANHPAKRGLRVFAVDVRWFGRSACPQRDAADWVVDGLVAAVAQLCQRGVTRVALVSASMGGSAALIAATRVKPPVDPVVELSGQAKPTSLFRIRLNGRGAVQQLTVPTMFVVADYDQYTR